MLLALLTAIVGFEVMQSYCIRELACGLVEVFDGNVWHVRQEPDDVELAIRRRRTADATDELPQRAWLRGFLRLLQRGR